MQRLHGATHRPANGLLAIALCSSLCFPAPLGLAQQASDQAPAQAKHRTEYEAGQLRGDERILHALNRFTFGPKPSDLEAVRAMGLEKWFDAQLHPATIDEADLNARLAEYPAMQWSVQDLIFRLPSNAIIRQAADGKVEIPADGTLHAVYENQIYRFQMRKAAQADKQATAATANPGTAMGQGTREQGNEGTSKRESAGEGVSADMGAGAGIAPNVPNATNATEPSPDQPSAVQPAMTQPQEMKAMTPAAAGQNSNEAVTQAPVDEALIARVLALPPQQRVTRLQSMQPEEFENFIKSLKPFQRVALIDGMSPNLKEALGDLENPEQTAVQELLAQRLTRDIYTNAQLQEVMTDFWLNHFNVYLRKNEQMPYYLVSYERDVIRPLALGKFEDLLEAVAHSPAMMLYLDNAQSVGPDSPAAERAKMAAARRPGAKKQAPEGLNENYARELMELHTLGVNGGYTQADVTQVRAS